MTAEAASRTAGIAAAKRELESAITAERTAWKQAILREGQARQSGDASATAALEAETRARTQAITAGDNRVKSEAAADVTTRLGQLESRLGARIQQAQAKVESIRRQSDGMERRVLGRVSAEVNRLNASIASARNHIPQHHHDLRSYHGQAVHAGFAPGRRTGAALQQQLERDKRAERERQARAERLRRERDRSAGTCVPGHTKVLMADGSWRAIKDVKVGEYVQGRTRANMVMAYDWLRLRENRNPFLFEINGDFQNTCEHPTLLEDGWAVLDHEAYAATVGVSHDCVYLADGTQVNVVFDFIKPEDVSVYKVGDSIAFGSDGYRPIESIEQVEADPDMTVYSLVCDGDGTMQVAGGYVLSAWVSDAKWNSRNRAD